jgi:hypothetical protein
MYFNPQKYYHVYDNNNETYAAAPKRVLDYYALNFFEELGALSGNLLQKQAEYTNWCIRYILNLYKTKNDGKVTNSFP